MDYLKLQAGFMFTPLFWSFIPQNAIFLIFLSNRLTNVLYVWSYGDQQTDITVVLTYLPPTVAICSFYISSLSKRKSITLIFKIPLSSYQRFPISFLTTILGNESPVSVNGLSSTSAFSSVGIAYADWI